MAIEVFNRYEHKYLLNKGEFEKFITVLDEKMELDEHNKRHGTYSISNIYFDTEDDFLIRTSLDKPIYKEKLRLRSYGVPNLSSGVFLEIKKKYNGVVNKRRTALELSEAYAFLKSGKVHGMKKGMNSQVVREIEYFMSVYKLKPKLYLAYDRIAYFDRTDRDLRISFDMNIRYRRDNLRLEKGDYGEKLLDNDVFLMEIKTSRAKPLWLCSLLSELGLNRRSFSKYGTAFKKMINKDIAEVMWGDADERVV